MLQEAMAKGSAEAHFQIRNVTAENDVTAPTTVITAVAPSWLL